MSDVFTFFEFLFILIGSLVVVAKIISLYSLMFNKNMNEVKRDWSWKPKVSIMMSAFNEGKAVYDSIESMMLSDYPLEQLEVIAYDDCSKDDTWEWLEKAKARWPSNVIIKKNEVNLGKAVTMVEISRASTGAILIGTDSDTIFAPNTIGEMVSCFADPEIGGVGGQIRIGNVNDSLLTQFQALYYVRVYYFYKSIENLFKTARCLAGPIAAYRREVFLPLTERILQRNFLGEHIAYGEDTFLTSHLAFGLIDKKWKIFTNLKAICWTGTPKTWTAYMNQQLRWRRGTIVNGLAVLRNLRHCIEVGGLAAAILCIVPMITVFMGLVMGLYLICVGSILQTTYIAMIVFFAVTMVFGMAYNLFIGNKDRAGTVRNPILAAGAYALWLPITMYWLTIVAVCTLDDGGWMTRQNVGNVG